MLRDRATVRSRDILPEVIPAGECPRDIRRSRDIRSRNSRHINRNNRLISHSRQDTSQLSASIRHRRLQGTSLLSELRGASKPETQQASLLQPHIRAPIKIHTPNRIIHRVSRFIPGRQDTARGTGILK